MKKTKPKAKKPTMNPAKQRTRNYKPKKMKQC